jgi:carbon starvation protein
VVELPTLDDQVKEHIIARPGGAVSLAVGMTYILGRLPGLGRFMAFLYHFAIMFEALFILTAMDAGTRVMRYILQELLGMAHPRFRETAWLPGALVCGVLVTLPWTYLAYTGTIKLLWPLGGISNQLLASIALVIGTTILIRAGKLRYVWVTLVPCAFILIVTFSAAVISITQQYIPQGKYLLAGLAMLFLTLATIILCTSLMTWYQLVFGPARVPAAAPTPADPK